MRQEGNLNDTVVQSCVAYHREIVRRISPGDDRDLLDKHCAALAKDIGQLDALREAMMQSAAQERDPVAIEKIQVFLGALERLMKTLRQFLEDQTAQQWRYLDRVKNPAMPSVKTSPKEKNEREKEEKGKDKKKSD